MNKLSIFVWIAALTFGMSSVSAAPKKPVPEKFHVVYVQEMDKTKSFQVFSTTELKQKTKQFKTDYAAAVKAYKASVKETKGKPTVAKPNKPILKKIKGNFKTKEEAEAFAAKVREKAAKKKTEKPASKPKGKTKKES